MRSEFDINLDNRIDHRGLWSVDHIVPAKQCGLFRGSKPLRGHLVRFVHYTEENKKGIGIRYLLIGDDMYPKKINFGNTYYISKEITEKINITFNGNEYPIRLLIEPTETEEFINTRLEEVIKTYYAMAQEVNASQLLNPNASPISDKKGIRPWAKIHIHHVGQGDTLVLELPDNQLWMIDARFWRKTRRESFDKWWKKHFGDRRLKRLIISHFHYDHIHSIPYVIEKYTPEQVVITDSLIHKTASTRKALHYAGNRVYILKGFEEIQLGQLKICLQRTDQVSNLNESIDPNDHEISVCLKTDKSFAFLAGDIPGNICHRLLSSNELGLSSNHNIRFYKVSHHGSVTGHDDDFLNLFNPDTSVISCGQNNRYNHPNQPPQGRLGRETITWQMEKDHDNWLLF